MPATPRPLAVGLMQLPAHATHRERSQIRIALAVKAADEGYALLETYEMGSYGLRDEAALNALRHLAERFPVQGVVHAGRVDLEAARVALESTTVRFFETS